MLLTQSLSKLKDECVEQSQCQTKLQSSVHPTHTVLSLLSRLSAETMCKAAPHLDTSSHGCSLFSQQTQSMSILQRVSRKHVDVTRDVQHGVNMYMSQGIARNVGTGKDV